jgi:hypothetical protein
LFRNQITHAAQPTLEAPIGEGTANPNVIVKLRPSTSPDRSQRMPAVQEIQGKSDWFLRLTGLPTDASSQRSCRGNILEEERICQLLSDINRIVSHCISAAKKASEKDVMATSPKEIDDYWFTLGDHAEGGHSLPSALTHLRSRHRRQSQQSHPELLDSQHSVNRSAS